MECAMQSTPKLPAQLAKPYVSVGQGRTTYFVALTQATTEIRRLVLESRRLLSESRELLAVAAKIDPRQREQ